MSRARTINYIALPVLLVAVVLNIYWVWGLVFVWWVILTIMSGQAFLVFEINRNEDPLLYWAIVAIWGALGGMMIAASLFPQYTYLLV